MKRQFNRVLSLVLVAALAVSIGLSGLLLPTVAASSNLLEDGNFEGTMSSKWDTILASGACSVVTDPTNDSNHVLEYPITSTVRKTYAFGDLGLQKNKTYMLTFDVLSTEGVNFALSDSKVTMITSKAYSYYWAGGYSASEFKSAAGTWKKWSFMFTTLDVENLSGALAIANYNATTAPIYVDNLVLEQVKDGNLRAEGDFEHGQNRTWNKIMADGAAQIVEDPTPDAVAGNHVLKIPAQAANFQWWFQMSNGLKPETKYEVQMRVYGGPVRFHCNGDKGIGPGGWKTLTGDDGAGGVNGWKDYLFEYTTTATPANDNWTFMFGTDAGSCGLTYIDDFRIGQHQETPAESIALNKTELVLGETGTETLKIVATPARSVYDTVVWKSSNESVATVDQTGKVTGVSAGTATVTATSGELTPVTCAVTVTAPVPVESVTLDPNTVSLKMDTVMQLTAVQNPSNALIKTAVWESDNEAVATVDETGLVTGHATGTATVKVTVNGEKTATCAVTVDNNVLEFSDFEGEVPSEGMWTSVIGQSDIAVATDPANSNNHALCVPVQTNKSNAVYIKSVKLKSSTMYKLSMRVYGEPAAIYLNPAWVTVDLPGANGWNALNTDFSWQPVEYYFVTKDSVNADFVLGFGNTSAKEPAYYDDIRLEPVLDPDCRSILVTPYALALLPGNSSKLNVAARPVGAVAKNLTFVSADPSVATVDANGTVTAVSEGKTKITVSATKVADYEVTVTVDQYGNIVKDGDFEAALPTTDYASFISAKAELVKDPTDKGNQVLMVKKGGGDMYYKGLNIAPNTTYRLTARVYGKLSFYANKCSAGGGDHAVNSEGKWGTVDFVFTTNELGDKNWTLCVKNPSADAYIDDLAVCKLPPAEGIELTPKNAELLPGGTATLTAMPVPSASAIGTVTYTSSDPAIVEVDAKTGKLTAMANSGTVTVTAREASGFTDTATVTINEYANMLVNGDFDQGASVNWGNNSLVRAGVGRDGSYGFACTKMQEQYYKSSLAVLEPATTYQVSFWYKMPTDVGDNAARLYGANIGFGSIYVKYHKEAPYEWYHVTKVFTTPIAMKLNATWDVAVVSSAETTEMAPVYFDDIELRLYDSGVEAQEIRLTTDAVTLAPGRSYNQAITAIPPEGNVNRTVWTSSDEDVVTVEYGVITAVGQGTATVTATTLNGKTATCTVNVSGVPALVKNGTFEKEGVWGYNAAAERTPNRGVQKSTAVKLTQNGKITQTVTGLKTKTTYQLFIRYYTSGGTAGISLTNGTADLLKVNSGNNTVITQQIFEFTTPEQLDATDSLLTIAANGNGPLYIDNVLLAEKASEVDLVISDIVWAGADDQVKPGTELTFMVTVANQGEDPVTAAQSFKVQLYLDAKPIQQLTYTGGLDVGGVNIVMGDTPWVAVAGEHTLSAKVNSELDILEKDDTNNTAQVSMRVAEDFLVSPKPAAKHNMGRLTFSDDFDSLATFDTTGSGEAGYKWYVTRPYVRDRLKTTDYSVENGILDLHLSNPVYNYGINTVDVFTERGYSFVHGYLEIRFRVAAERQIPGTSGSPAIWSFPTEKIYSRASEWIEMDWMEYWGHNSYTMCMWVNETDGSKYGNDHHYADGLADEEWHTMGWLVDSGVYDVYYDGERVLHQTWKDGEFDDPMPTSVEGSLIHECVFKQLETQDNTIILCGAEGWPMQVDWVHVWQEGGDVPEYEDDDDDDDDDGGEGVTVDVEDFCWNYATDDWGDNIVDVRLSNYAYLLEGGELWDQLTEECKTAINAYLADNGQPNYEMLAAGARLLQKAMEEDGYDFLYDCFVNEVDDDFVLNLTVTKKNKAAISAAEGVWNALSDDEKEELDALLTAAGGMTFEEYLLASPETGDAYPLMAVAALVLAAALVVFTRKRRVLDK